MEITGDTEKRTSEQARKIIIAGVILGLAFGFFLGRTEINKKPTKIAINGTATSTTDVPSKTVAVKQKEESITKKAPISVSASAIHTTGKLTAPSTENTANSVTLSDQSAGMSVSVKRVALTKDGWVAVREDIEGEMGNVLGAQWLPKGTETGVIIELLRGTRSGQKYYVVLYSDNGDHRFSTKADTLISAKPLAFIAQ